MRRINIDPEFWVDYRLIKLVEKLGQKLAYGSCLLAFQQAQIFWAKDKKPIPFAIWNLLGLGDLIEVGLAEETPEGIYVKGSRDSFDWLEKAREAGKRGGRPKKGLKRNRNLTVTDTITVTDNNKTLETSSLVISPGEKTHVLAEIWNELRGPAQPAVRKLSPARLKKAKLRLKENPNLDEWREAMAAIASSDFCNGKNDRGWVANFDFFITPGKCEKALEGAYSGGPKEPDKPKTFAEMSPEEQRAYYTRAGYTLDD